MKSPSSIKENILLKILSCNIVLYLFFPVFATANEYLYTGTMKAVTTSGNACQGQYRTQQIELIIRHDNDLIEGFFDVRGVTTGTFSGTNISQLEVHYPTQDQSLPSGHFISIKGDGNALSAELREMHLEPTDEDCSFDLARMKLMRSKDVDGVARFNLIKGLYEAQTTRFQAVKLARSGRYVDSVPVYQKALNQAESLVGANSLQIVPYLNSLTNVYLKLKRIDELNKLHDQYLTRMLDEDIRSVFIAHSVNFLLQAGKTSLEKEDYSDALMFLQKAYKLAPQNRDVGAAIMLVYLRSDKRDNAISFLEQALNEMSSEDGRQDVSLALANIYLERANDFDKEGKNTEAANDLIRADNLNPSIPRYLIALARLRHKEGNWLEAKHLLQKALERYEDDSLRQEILSASDKLQQTELMLEKLRKLGN